MATFEYTTTLID